MNKKYHKKMKIHLLFCCLFGLLFWSCDEEGDINLFSIEDDMELGAQLRDEVLSQTNEYDVLDELQYEESYEYIDGMVQEILASGEVRYAEEFAWEVYLLNDETLNAFAAPGGYIFIYTGLIQFLEQPDDLAGVLAHEMAHADLRHSTDQLTQQYGISLLLSLILGEENQSLITDVLSTIVDLRFSRSDESEADAFSVQYLCETQFASNGAASFFEKLKDDTNNFIPEFLSTHPSPENRVEQINQIAEDSECDTTQSGRLTSWEAFQRSLP